MKFNILKNNRINNQIKNLIKITNKNKMNKHKKKIN